MLKGQGSVIQHKQMRATKKKFLNHTREIWQQRTTKVLALEDARQIYENTTGFFRILMEWDTADRCVLDQDESTEKKG